MECPLIAVYRGYSVARVGRLLIQVVAKERVEGKGEEPHG